MGRELKRVPLDFNWPIDEVWKGYLNPHGNSYVRCITCKGMGRSPQFQELVDQWYGNVELPADREWGKPWTPEDKAIRLIATRNIRGNYGFYRAQAEMVHMFDKVEITEEEVYQVEAKRLCGLYNGRWSTRLTEEDVDALTAANRLWDFTRVAITQEQHEIVKRRVRSGKCNSWLPFSNGHRPSARDVSSYSIVCFTGIDYGPVLSAYCAKHGISTNCPTCHGEGGHYTSEEDRQAYETWTKEEPPTGEGYQVWETVSEGSPISPVFQSPEQLANYMVEHRPNEGSYDNWLQFIYGPGWVPGMVFNGEQMATGAKIMELYADEEETRYPKLGIRDKAALSGMRLVGTRKQLRKKVRQMHRRYGKDYVK